MTGKINGFPGGAPRVDTGSKTNGVRPASGEGRTEAPAGSSDQVSLTGSGQMLVRLEKILEDLPVVDRERVDTVKQAIRDGSYKVDAQRVAAAVLRMEKELG